MTPKKPKRRSRPALIALWSRREAVLLADIKRLTAEVDLLRTVISHTAYRYIVVTDPAPMIRRTPRSTRVGKR